MNPKTRKLALAVSVALGSASVGLQAEDIVLNPGSDDVVIANLAGQPGFETPLCFKNPGATGPAGGTGSTGALGKCVTPPTGPTGADGATGAAGQGIVPSTCAAGKFVTGVTAGGVLICADLPALVEVSAAGWICGSGSADTCRNWTNTATCPAGTSLRFGGYWVESMPSKSFDSVSGAASDGFSSVGADTFSYTDKVVCFVIFSAPGGSLTEGGAPTCRALCA